MAVRFSSKLILAATVAPLALGLAACKKEGESADGTAAAVAESTPLPKVPAPVGKTWADVVETTPEGGYRMGNPEAPIKLVEYGSLSCPHCAKFATEGFQKLAGDYVGSGRVSFEFRSFAIHSVDVPLTVLVTCGPKESVFPLIEQIYSNFEAVMTSSQSPQALDAAQKAMLLPENQRFVTAAQAMGLTAFFAQRGISVDQANACLGDFSKAKGVADLAKKYGEDGVNGTPTLLVNGSKINGTEWAEVESALQRAGAR